MIQPFLFHFKDIANEVTTSLKIVTFQPQLAKDLGDYKYLSSFIKH